MIQDCRGFLAGAARTGATAGAVGCLSAGKGPCDSAGAPMHGFAVPSQKRIRVGMIGGGGRVDFPDCARGGRKTARPSTFDEVDMDKVGFKSGVIRAKNAQAA